MAWKNWIGVWRSRFSCWISCDFFQWKFRQNNWGSEHIYSWNCFRIFRSPLTFWIWVARLHLLSDSATWRPSVNQIGLVECLDASRDPSCQKDQGLVLSIPSSQSYLWKRWCSACCFRGMQTAVGWSSQISEWGICCLPWRPKIRTCRLLGLTQTRSSWSNWGW